MENANMTENDRPKLNSELFPDNPAVADTRALRATILTLCKEVNRLRATCASVTLMGLAVEPNRGEMIANATLAYRHLEDARMRLGKVIQAFDGGESCYKS